MPAPQGAHHRSPRPSSRSSRLGLGDYTDISSAKVKVHPGDSCWSGVCDGCGSSVRRLPGNRLCVGSRLGGTSFPAAPSTATGPGFHRGQEDIGAPGWSAVATEITTANVSCGGGDFARFGREWAQLGETLKRIVSANRMVRRRSEIVVLIELVRLKEETWIL